MQSIFYDHNGIKLEVSNREMPKHLEVKDILLNNNSYSNQDSVVLVRERDIDQKNRTEGSEMDPHKNAQLILTVFSTNGAGGNGHL